MLINVKMATTSSESLKTNQESLIFYHFSFYEQLKFNAHLS